jgi:hypothetical protein
VRTRILSRGPARSAQPALAELESQALRALVATDDAVRTSDQELGFATATFGERAVAQFTAALVAARAELAQAFQLRQLLDDDAAGSRQARRSMLTEILARCAAANRLLDDKSAAFDQLQDLNARAPAVLSEVTAHVAQQAARVPATERMLAQLAVAYTQDAVAVVSDCPDQAGNRLRFAGVAAVQAKQELAAGRRDRAAVCLRTAESAADHAESLLDAVEHLQAELTQAASALPATLREIEAELAEAGVLIARTSGAAAADTSRAQQAVASVRAAMAGGRPLDTLAALRALADADTALDSALGGSRSERDRKDRARAILDQAFLLARSSVTTADDFITTRRGGVGAQARTRLAEARRHFQQAIGFARQDQQAALTEARHADTLGQQARSLAERDVARAGRERAPALRVGGRFGGSFGGTGTSGRGPDAEAG